MQILTIDTALQGCTVGIYDTDEDTIIENAVKMERGQAEHLIPMIEEIVSDFEKIDMIAVVRGPGAFAGLKIGLMSAKTFGMVLKVPVIGVTSFDAIYETTEKKAQAVILETKRKDYYAQIRHKEPQCLTAAEIEKTINGEKITIAGNANNRLKDELQSHDNVEFIDCELSSPKSVAKTAFEQFKTAPNKVDISPLYLRGPEIGTPKKKPRKLSN